VGKTSVSNQLAAQLNALHIDLGELVIKEKLSYGIDQKRGTLIADKARLARRVNQIIRLKGRIQGIIIDGHYAQDIISPKNVTKVFVLRRDPEELKQLMEKRGFHGRKLWENLAAETLDVCLFEAIRAFGSNKVCEINVTHKKPALVARTLALILGKKQTCTIGNIDWLGKLEKEGKLGDYLKELQ
jgi:adenylate kinase